jgi:hypothetical protein
VVGQPMRFCARLARIYSGGRFTVGSKDAAKSAPGSLDKREDEDSIFFV